MANIAKGSSSTVITNQKASNIVEARKDEQIENVVDVSVAMQTQVLNKASLQKLNNPKKPCQNNTNTWFLKNTKF